MVKARDLLDKMASICGNTACREYVMLKEAIEGHACLPSPQRTEPCYGTASPVSFNSHPR